MTTVYNATRRAVRWCQPRRSYITAAFDRILSDSELCSPFAITELLVSSQSLSIFMLSVDRAVLFHFFSNSVWLVNFTYDVDYKCMFQTFSVLQPFLTRVFAVGYII